jgi:putative transposase
MPYNPTVHHRRTIRLQGFDYSQAGSYFVTMVTYGRECLFGIIENGQLQSTLAGQCVTAVLQTLPSHFPITLDAWVIMPNHVHILLTIIGTSELNSRVDSIPLEPYSIFGGIQARSLGALIQNYKSISTRRIHAIQYYSQIPV